MSARIEHSLFLILVLFGTLATGAATVHFRADRMAQILFGVLCVLLLIMAPLAVVQVRRKWDEARMARASLFSSGMYLVGLGAVAWLLVKS